LLNVEDIGGTKADDHPRFVFVRLFTATSDDRPENRDPLLTFANEATDTPPGVVREIYADDRQAPIDDQSGW
jgi:hypothetical protein